jgi:hypothetical protein
MRRVLITVLLLGAGVAVAFFLNRRTDEAPVRRAEASPEPSAKQETPSWLPEPADMPDAGVDAGMMEPEPQPFRFDLADLDFDALRRRTPESLYWLMAAPTDDPAVLEARAQAREERNRQYGKVVSNTATVEEIRDYYAYRRKLSEDYIEMLQLIMDEHGDELSERDAGLFELTIAMHTERLAEIPSKLDDALQRKAEYDRVKAEWQKQRREDSEGAP